MEKNVIKIFAGLNVISEKNAIKDFYAKEVLAWLVAGQTQTVHQTQNALTINVKTLVIQILVVQMQNVELLTIGHYVFVQMAIMATLMSNVLNSNARKTTNAALTKRAYKKNVKIHVYWEAVD